MPSPWQRRTSPGHRRIADIRITASSVPALTNQQLLFDLIGVIREIARRLGDDDSECADRCRRPRITTWRAQNGIATSGDARRRRERRSGRQEQQRAQLGPG